jgi:protease-4
MADNKPSFIVGFFQGLWGALNFLRRLTFNLIFVFLVIVFIVALRASAPLLRSRTALVLDPKGNIVEQYTSAPAQRAFAGFFGDKVHEVQLRDVLAVIAAAADDEHIERLVLVPDDIDGAGLASLREIATAIDHFRQSGKEVVAVSNGMTQGQYYLAAHADQVLLHPQGGIVLEGLGRYRSYYKDALDRLGVAVHLFRVGEYKSAAEPYVRNDSSPEAKDADLFWMNGVWGDYIKDIAAARKLDAIQLSAQIQNYPDTIKEAQGDLAALALKQKLVDRLATRDEARSLLIDKGVKDDKTFRQIDFQDYLHRIDREKLPDTRVQVAVVVAEGEILGGDQAPGTVGGESTSGLIRAAREDDKVKALVLRVNSPGGEVFASELIRREVELTRLVGKPVVVSMGDVAGSGGYYVAAGADAIVAEQATITGSIGVVYAKFNLGSMLNELGVHFDFVKSAPISDAMSMARAMTEAELAQLNETVGHLYAAFTAKVAEGRHLSPEQAEAVAKGRIWSGIAAKERGLIDEVGGLSTAVAIARDRAHIAADKRHQLVTYRAERRWLDFRGSSADLSTSWAIRAAASTLGIPTRWAPSMLDLLIRGGVMLLCPFIEL